MDFVAVLSEEFGFTKNQVENTLALFDEGATVPFIARYRKERTGSLDEIQIRDLEHKYNYYKELEERRTTILDSIKEQEKLTPELEKKILATRNKTELEDLYLPYKPKRTTRATKARDAGLEPLAQWLRNLESPTEAIEAKAKEFINVEKGYETETKALRGAGDILAEELSDNADNRKWLREFASSTGFISSTVKKDFADKKTKFDMYYDYKEKVSDLPSHRILAMLRGEKEKVLRIALDIDFEKAQSYLESRLILHPRSASADFLKSVAKDSLERLLMVATETEIRKELRDRADLEAFLVFAENLRNLLLAAPAGQKAVLAIDPGFRTGCKVVDLDKTGQFLEYKTIFPNAPQKKYDEAKHIVFTLMEKYDVELIAIGNGTASRETQSFIKEILPDYKSETTPICIIVNESGASVYSASEIAIKEFPDQDITVRGAVSIGRRLQDPLSELVKIDPKSIGVGQYQHDVNQVKLKTHLEEVVESCVNTVGVNLNLASEELLKYVSGLTRSTAKKIVSYRNAKGAFKTREELLEVSGFGNKAFEQAAGFLRIPDAENPLDNSAVHPERYKLVQQMVSELDEPITEIIGHREKIVKIDKNKFVTEEVGLPTIEDILSEIEKPGRDPRDEFTYATFDDEITEITDLKEGMKLEGTVTNVTNFGAFVDVGVHQDGLVHISELADRFVDDPKKIVKVGQVVNVKVVSVDVEMKRIALSMRTGAAPAQSGGAKRQDKKSGGANNPFKKKGGNKDNQKSGKLKTYKPKFSVKSFMK